MITHTWTGTHRNAFIPNFPIHRSYRSHVQKRSNAFHPPRKTLARIVIGSPQRQPHDRPDLMGLIFGGRQRCSAHQGRILARRCVSGGAALPQDGDVTRRRLPREERAERIGSLRDAGLSYPAIAAATGLGIGTVHRELSGVPFRTPEPEPYEPSGLDEFARDETDGDALAEKVSAELAAADEGYADRAAKVTGLDGKSHTALRPNTTPRRKALTESFWKARYELDKRVKTLTNLAARWEVTHALIVAGARDSGSAGLGAVAYHRGATRRDRDICVTGTHGGPVFGGLCGRHSLDGHGERR